MIRLGREFEELPALIEINVFPGNMKFHRLRVIGVARGSGASSEGSVPCELHCSRFVTMAEVQ